jgi:hypothetical protein
MRFRFPRFALRICSEGVDNNIATNLASMEPLVEIENSGVNRKAHSWLDGHALWEEGYS